MVRENEVHTLKTWLAGFQAIWDERKRFEVRYDDRGFRAGDHLHLVEYNPLTATYTGRFMIATVGYIATCPNMGLLRENVVVMGLVTVQRFVPKVEVVEIV